MYLIIQNEPDLNQILDRVGPSGFKFGSSGQVGLQGRKIGSIYVGRLGSFATTYALP